MDVVHATTDKRVRQQQESQYLDSGKFSACVPACSGNSSALATFFIRQRKPGNTKTWTFFDDRRQSKRRGPMSISISISKNVLNIYLLIYYIRFYRHKYLIRQLIMKDEI